MLLGIDPGVNNCGVAVIDTSTAFRVLDTLNIKNVRKFTDDEKVLEKDFGTRPVKVLSIVREIEKTLVKFPEIKTAAIEAPFYHHLTPQAYGSLLEVVSAIRYNILIPQRIFYEMLPPMSVKKLFTDKGAAKKELMKRFLLQKKEDGSILIDLDIEMLTEHEIDAIAIAYTYYVNLRT